MADRVTPLREAVEPTILPSSTELEQNLIGAIFVNGAAYAAVSEKLRPEHFSNALHGRIYSAIARLAGAGSPVTAVILKAEFDRDPALIDAGGAGYLGRLIEAAVTVSNAPYYADAIIDAYRRRMLIAAADELRDRALAYNPEDTVERQIEEAGARLFDLAGEGSAANRVTSGGEAAAAALEASQNAYKAGGQLAGISSGIVALDKLVGGFAPGDLYIVGGRPGMGKTSAVGSIAWAALLSGHPTHFFSAEMTAKDLMRRMMAAMTGISASRQRRGDLMAGEWEQLMEAQRTIAGWPLTIDDGPMTLARIRQQLRQSQRRAKTALAIVDYLQLVTSGSESDTRLADVGRVSNGLKRAAKDLEIPIIACAQLSRAVEGRDNKRPMMSDLRYAGEIEQDADAIVFIYRDEVYLKDATPTPRERESDADFGARWGKWKAALEASRGKCELLVVKSRHDEPGTANVLFDGARSFIYDVPAESTLL